MKIAHPPWYLRKAEIAWETDRNEHLSFPRKLTTSYSIFSIEEIHNILMSSRTLFGQFMLYTALYMIIFADLGFEFQ